MTIQIISRSKAAALGLKRYFTGKPCPRMHVAERAVSSRGCFKCKAEDASARHAKNPEPGRAAARRWARENPEKARAKHAKSKVKRNARSRQYAKDHPELFRRYAAHRRAVVAGAVGSFTEADIQALYALQKGRCAYCRKKLGQRYEIDHIKPLSKGGANYLRNLQLLCRLKCNQSKRDKDPLDYARSIGRLI